MNNPQGKDVRIDTKISVIIHWFDPPKNLEEKLERGAAQAAVDKVADLLAKDIAGVIFDDLIKQGAIKPKVDKRIIIANGKGTIDQY